MVAYNRDEENRFMMRIYISIIILCVTLSAFASSATSKTQENKVVHVVLVWLKQPGNHEHIQQVVEVSNQLKEIPYIQEMRIGKSIPSDRAIVDDSFDVGLYMIFANQEDMQRYLVHPDHKNAVKKVLKPLASKIQVYDFETLGN